MQALSPRPGEVMVDCTLGWAGHSRELLRAVAPEGLLIAVDLDADNLSRAEEPLQMVDGRFVLHHGNFAGLANVLAELNVPGVDGLIADLGMSSMQVDDAERGFSYSRDGPLDMRMDRSRGRTAAQLLATISEGELAEALRELGDEPEAERIAHLIVTAREQTPLERTSDLSSLLLEATAPKRQGKQWRLRPRPGQWEIHPAARTFQTLRILVNRELANLQQLLRMLPTLLKPGGRAVIISFHSGEDRLVKSAFRDGLRSGIFEAASDDPLRASYTERTSNPRSRSAKLRWARRTLSSAKLN
jgi:16S rRNA (cytosine1402-N4)-methyltransferase